MSQLHSSTDIVSNPQPIEKAAGIKVLLKCALIYFYARSNDGFFMVIREFAKIINSGLLRVSHFAVAPNQDMVAGS